MLPYQRTLKPLARTLRRHATEAEQVLWERLRRKQVLGMPFDRQKPIAGYIVDFYCAAARLVVELDGSQHSGADAQAYDLQRTQVLEALGLRVLRFGNGQVQQDLATVMGVIEAAVREGLTHG
jgi:very-short-patch-repair endonuclease